MLLFDRGISGKIAGQEIRSLRNSAPPELPLVVSGRAVNLLAKPIADVRTAADFSSVMATMRELGVLPLTPVSLVGVLAGTAEPRLTRRQCYLGGVIPATPTPDGAAPPRRVDFRPPACTAHGGMGPDRGRHLADPARLPRPGAHLRSRQLEILLTSADVTLR